MERKYIVELKSPLQEPQLSRVAAEVGEELKISPEKFSTLLRRGAGPLTKGVDASVAERIARVARAAGADIELIETGGVAQVAPQPVAATPAREPAPAPAWPSPEVTAPPRFEPQALEPKESGAAPTPTVTFAARPKVEAQEVDTREDDLREDDSREFQSYGDDLDEVAAVEVASPVTRSPEERFRESVVGETGSSASTTADAGVVASEPAPGRRAPWLLPTVLVAVVALVVVAYLVLL